MTEQPTEHDVAPPPSLGDLLVTASRQGPESRVAAMAGIGVVGAAIVAAVLGRKGWLFAAGLLAIGAYGCWALADRKLQRMYAMPGSSRPRERLFEFARLLSGLVAVVAAVSALGSIFLPLFGLWRS